MSLLLLLLLLPSPLHPYTICEVEIEVTKVGSQMEVNCEDLRLTGLPADLPADTNILYLGKNHLVTFSTASLSRFTNLIRLYLDHTELTSLQCDEALPSLESLYISHNKLKSLPSLGRALPALHTLDVSFNQLSSLSPDALDGLSQLKYLYLQGNKLRHLHPGLLAPTPLLMQLNLANNQLIDLPVGLLNNLDKLNTLFLQGNWLQNVPKDFFGDLLLPFVFLHGNSWLCDCDILYFRRWLLNNSNEVYIGKEGMDFKNMTPNVDSVRCSNMPNIPVHRYPVKGCPGAIADIDYDDYDIEEDIVLATRTVVKFSTNIKAYTNHWGLLHSESTVPLDKKTSFLFQTQESTRKLTTLPPTQNLDTSTFLMTTEHTTKSTTTPTTPELTTILTTTESTTTLITPEPATTSAIVEPTTPTPPVTSQPTTIPTTPRPTTTTLTTSEPTTSTTPKSTILTTLETTTVPPTPEPTTSATLEPPLPVDSA
ncbi:platelet glycoprotein Ib alpha chain [Ctenodactylus gundi]